MSIYTLNPVNKTASIVTSQPKELTKQELLNIERENLISRRNQIENEISKSTNKHHKKRLGAKLFEINESISKIKKDIARFNMDRRTFENILLDVVKENIGEFQFKKFVDIARSRYNKGV